MLSFLTFNSCKFDAFQTKGNQNRKSYANWLNPDLVNTLNPHIEQENMAEWSMQHCLQIAQSVPSPFTLQLSQVITSNQLRKGTQSTLHPPFPKMSH
jgi:hypothetical protein